MSLHLGFCSHEAADFACRAWHYSRSLPASRRVCLGAWESGHFVGAVVFSRGACQHIGRPFGLRQSAVCELTRVALGPHQAPTSRIVAIAVRLLRRQSPGIQLLVSFADPVHGHDGRGIYAALGWLYLGPTAPESLLRIRGRLLHPRTVGSRYGTRAVSWLRTHVDPAAERIVTPPKHRYVLPFDAAMQAQLAPLARPYPRRKEQAPRSPLGLAGATPSPPLHLQEAAHA